MKQIIKLLMVMLMLGGVACTTNGLDGGNDLGGGNPDNNDTNELHNHIWYTATEKVTPNATNVFGANIVSNVWNETTGEGVITFDGEVTSIGEGAFMNCTSLASITIPDGVTSIGEYAFNHCESLASITIPEGVTSIGEYAFNDCTSLASITIPDSVTEIGNGVFWSCSSLANIIIPNSVTLIGDYAFRDCSSLTSITIPEGVTSIGTYAFYRCSSLASITIPDGVTSIGDGAFNGCSSLAEFNGKFASEDGRCLIVDGVLNSFAPYGLTEYTIPKGVTSIGYGVFENCSSLASITIPAGVTSIGNWAFCGCSSLAEVYCKPTTPPSGDYNMFDNNAPECKIYVPAESVEAYKTATHWSNYADIIEGYDFE